MPLDLKKDQTLYCTFLSHTIKSTTNPTVPIDSINQTIFFIHTKEPQPENTECQTSTGWESANVLGEWVTHTHKHTHTKQL